MNNIQILYIGNNLKQHSNYPTTIETLSSLLESEGCKVYKTSSKKNKLLRMVDMCFTVVKHKKVDYLLIDTYSTTNFYFAYLGAQLARLFKIKYIPILHGGNLPIRLNKSKRLCNSIFNNSIINVAPSPYLKQYFNKNGYRTILIPNNIEVEKYVYKKREIINPSILFVRSFAKIYNPVMAIHVLYKLRKVYKDAKLCMVGPDKDGSLTYVKKITKKLNLEDYVEFTGVLDREEWHNKASNYDVFINTTNVDNTPVSVIEAMALGLPVVSTNVGGLSYLIDDEFDGLLVGKNDVEQMVLAIGSLIEGKHSLITINARKKAEGFSWNIIKEKWYKVLK
jgi:glycosyltransferase involved in cell wall biosynthesis